jgi:hypothetical protein
MLLNHEYFKKNMDRIPQHEPSLTKAFIDEMSVALNFPTITAHQLKWNISTS